MASERSKELGSVLWLGAGLFLLAAMLSFQDAVLPAAEESWRNVCGRVGFVAARALLGAFGFAAFLIPVTFLGEGIRLFRRASARPMALRTLWMALFMPILATVLHAAIGGTSEWIPDPGGDVGITLASLLETHSGLGILGGRIALAVLLLATFVLWSGFLYSRAAAAGIGWVSKRRVPGVLRWRGGKADRSAGRSAERGARPRRADRDAELSAATPATRADRGCEGAAGNPEGEAPVPASSDSASPSNLELDAELERSLAALRSGIDEERAAAAAPAKAADAPKVPVMKRLGEKLRRRRDRAAEDTAEPPAAADRRKPASETPASAPIEPAVAIPSRPYQFPPIHLLEPPERESGGDFLRFTEETARKLTGALRSFRVEARVVGVQRGPAITMLEVELAAGTKLTRLRALEDDLAMALAAQSVRIVAPIPGKSTAGIEIPNDARDLVRLSELLQWRGYNPQKFAIPIFLGKDASGAPRVEDLAKMPHLLVAGSTGSGKSVCLNTLILSILFTRTPEQVKLILIDPKMVELSSFQNVPHLMCPVVTDMKRASGILEWAAEKMEERYALLHRVGVRNIYAYNKLGDEEVRKRLGEELAPDFETTLPFIVIVIDELADLMLQHGKDVEQTITRLAQKSRAVGIHVLLATQRPSTNVITGLIKANLPTRIAFRVTSKIDSRVILDQNGADKLLGQGDMLYVPPGSPDLMRVQGCFVTDQEIRDVVTFLAEQGPPSYSRELIQKRTTTDRDPAEIDDLYEEAARFVVETQRGSASLLQRRFSIGYTRASRLIDLMAADGVLGEFKGSQAREVLCATLEDLERRRAEQRESRGAKSTGTDEGAGRDRSELDDEPMIQEAEA